MNKKELLDKLEKAHTAAVLWQYDVCKDTISEIIEEVSCDDETWLDVLEAYESGLHMGIRLGSK